MKIKNRLSGVQVSIPDALAEELIEKGTYQTVGAYDADQRAQLEAERERQLAVLRGEDPDAEDDGDEKPAKETAAQKRKREAAEAAEREAAEKAAADKAAADKAAADAAAAGQ